MDHRGKVYIDSGSMLSHASDGRILCMRISVCNSHKHCTSTIGQSSAEPGRPGEGGRGDTRRVGGAERCWMGQRVGRASEGARVVGGGATGTTSATAAALGLGALDHLLGGRPAPSQPKERGIDLRVEPPMPWRWGVGAWVMLQGRTH